MGCNLVLEVMRVILPAEVLLLEHFLDAVAPQHRLLFLIRQVVLFAGEKFHFPVGFKIAPDGVLPQGVLVDVLVGRRSEQTQRCTHPSFKTMSIFWEIF